CLLGRCGSAMDSCSLGILGGAGCTELEIGAGLLPLAQFLAEDDRLVDQQLSVIGSGDLDSLQRPRRWSLEVGSILPETRPVAGALELVFWAQPARRASSLPADAQQGVEAAPLADHPPPLVL